MNAPIPKAHKELLLDYALSRMRLEPPPPPGLSPEWAATIESLRALETLELHAALAGFESILDGEGGVGAARAALRAVEAVFDPEGSVHYPLLTQLHTHLNCVEMLACAATPQSVALRSGDPRSAGLLAWH